MSALPPRKPGQPYLAMPAHCFLTAARTINLLGLVIAGDWLVRLKLASPGRLLSTASESRVPGLGSPGGRRGWCGIAWTRPESRDCASA
ncbi:MAG TPA: hypothetical protein VIT42_05875, partial [Microlunatus sp.]